MAPSRLARLTSPGGLFVTSALLLAALPVTEPLRDPDFWWHLRAGQMIIARRGLLGTDPFTYTVASHHWTMHEWLTEVLFAALHSVGGIGPVVVVFSILTWLGLAAVALRAGLHRPRPLSLGAGIILAAIAGYPIWGPRAQMITFTFTCLTLWLAERHLVRGGRAVWLLVPMVLLWSNLHSGFIIGLGLVGLVVAGELAGARLGMTGGAPLRRVGTLAAVLLAATGASMVNPNGPGILLYPFATQGSAPQQALIQEWHSPDFHLWEVRAFEVELLSLGLMIAINRRLPARDALLAAATTVLALQSARHIALFVAVATPVWITQCNLILERRQQRAPRPVLARPRPPAVALTLILAAVLLAAAGGRLQTTAAIPEDSPSYARDYPVCAVRWLLHFPRPLRIFNQYGEGGYLAYRLSARGDRVFIFGDAALMGDPLLLDYSAVETLREDWNDIIRAASPDVVIFDQNTPLADVMLHSPRWTEIYSDLHNLVFMPAGQAATTIPPPPVAPSAGCGGVIRAGATAS